MYNVQMKYKILLLLPIVLLFTTSSLVSADTVSDLRTELQTVLNKIEELKSELILVESGITPGESGASCISINQDLKKGMENAEVKRLQVFLAQDPGVYPENITSGYFGNLTELAVQRWQAKHGVVSYGSAYTTGFGLVGPQTRRAIAASCTGTISTVAGADNIIDFTFITKSARAPFVSTAKIVMLQAACMSYRVDWGDGSDPTTHMATRTTDCGVGVSTQTLTHTYTAAGNYTTTLYAGKGNVAQLPKATTSNITILPGDPFVKVITPNGGDTLKLGDTTKIRWQVANQPTDSAIVFYIVGPTGTYRFAKRSHRSQEFNWIVGDRVCDGNGCNVNLPIGTNYKVRAVLYTPADACIDFCEPDSVTPEFLTNDESDSDFSIGQLGNNGNDPLIVPVIRGKAPFTATISVKLAPINSGVGNFEVDFGDGSQSYRIHIPAGETRTTERTISHIYTSTGDYNLQLRPVGAVQYISEKKIYVSESRLELTPQANVTAPVTVQATIDIDNTCSHTEDTLRVYTIDWGDRTETTRYEVRTNKCLSTSSSTQQLSTRIFTHDYLQPGAYSVELITSVNGNSTKQVDSVDIDDLVLDVSPRFGFKPLTVTAKFAAETSCIIKDADVVYTIDWGDGTDTSYAVDPAVCGTTASISTTEKEYSHIYSNLGRYYVSLTLDKSTVGSSRTSLKEVVVDTSAIRNTLRKFTLTLTDSNIGENMAAAIQSIFKK